MALITGTLNIIIITRLFDFYLLKSVTCLQIIVPRDFLVLWLFPELKQLVSPTIGFFSLDKAIKEPVHEVRVEVVKLGLDIFHLVISFSSFQSQCILGEGKKILENTEKPKLKKKNLHSLHLLEASATVTYVCSSNFLSKQRERLNFCK